MLNTVLNKCETVFMQSFSKPRLSHGACPVTASYYKDFNSPIVCLWKELLGAQQGKKGHLKVHFEF